MKTLALIALLGLPVLAVPEAQTAADSPRAGQARGRLRQLQERLQLTPEQVEQVRPVLAEEAQKLKAVREKRGEEAQGRRARVKMGREVRGIRGETDEKLSKILSKKQMDELKKVREEWRRERKQKRPAGD
ncbi:MAG TPA: hypothetical protein VN442_23625 [Bryobacteraceae bacterium]|nr:hypothetical protein [Bryobacteraceae bacterium]